MIFFKIMEFHKRGPIRRRSKKRAMAGQAQKRSPPHILADEHLFLKRLAIRLRRTIGRLPASGG
jgi:hypothetical protein